MSMQAAVAVAHEIEISAEAKHGKQVQRLFGGQDVRVAQDGESAADLVAAAWSGGPP
jgi:hypothetical protein